MTQTPNAATWARRRRLIAGLSADAIDYGSAIAIVAALTAGGTA
jgi:hypothetical protein